MSADAKQVLRILDYRGIDVRVEDGHLIAKPRQGHIPDDMVRFIGHFKEIIVSELEARQDATLSTAIGDIGLLHLPGKRSGGPGAASTSSDDPGQRRRGVQHAGP